MKESRGSSDGTSDVSDVDRMRGLLTGLVLGDALGAGGAGAEGLGSIRIGVAGQLACFTVDTLIRAHCREQDKGMGTDRAVLAWLNHRRWARLQRLPVAAAEQAMHSEPHTDDWMALVPAFVQRRGSAPATTAAVATSRSGESDVRRESQGAHGLIRVLPLAAAGVALRGAHWFGDVKKMAELTHSPDVGDLALMTARWLSCSWASADVWRGAQLVLTTGADHDGAVLETALGAHQKTADPVVLQQPAPNRSARAAVVGGLHAALSCHDSGAVEETLINAAAVPKAGPGVAAVAGAALGAVYGIDSLPEALVGRLEVREEIDRLARDLAATLELGPYRSDLSADYYTI